MKNTMAKSYFLKMKIAEHGSCTQNTHEDCNWDMILKETLQKQFPDLDVIKPTITPDNILQVELKTKHGTVPKTELSWRLDDFFNHNRLVTMESYLLR